MRPRRAARRPLLRRLREGALSAVEVEDLHKRYGPVAALDGVSLRVAAGSVTLIAGPNGAGKSTLLRVLAGLTRPTRGAVRIDGADPFGAGAAARRGRTGFLGPELALYGELSVEENLRFWARVHGIGPARGVSLVADLGLDAVVSRPLRTLSLGYRRRAALARALLTDPALLLLDEPWNGLDERAGATLVRIVEQQRERGGTTFVAAHAPGERAGLFDGVVELDSGRIAGAR